MALAVALAGCAPPSDRAAGAPPVLYVANSADGTVARLDGATGRPLGPPLPAGPAPGQLARGRDGSLLVLSAARDAARPLTRLAPAGDGRRVGGAPRGLARAGARGPPRRRRRALRGGGRPGAGGRARPARRAALPADAGRRPRRRRRGHAPAVCGPHDLVTGLALDDGPAGPVAYLALWRTRPAAPGGDPAAPAGAAGPHRVVAVDARTGAPVAVLPLAGVPVLLALGPAPGGLGRRLYAVERLAGPEDEAAGRRRRPAARPPPDHPGGRERAAPRRGPHAPRRGARRRRRLRPARPHADPPRARRRARPERGPAGARARPGRRARPGLRLQRLRPRAVGLPAPRRPAGGHAPASARPPPTCWGVPPGDRPRRPRPGGGRGPARPAGPGGGGAGAGAGAGAGRGPGRGGPLRAGGVRLAGRRGARGRRAGAALRGERRGRHRHPARRRQRAGGRAAPAGRPGAGAGGARSRRPRGGQQPAGALHHGRRGADALTHVYRAGAGWATRPLPLGVGARGARLAGDGGRYGAVAYHVPDGDRRGRGPGGAAAWPWWTT